MQNNNRENLENTDNTEIDNSLTQMQRDFISTVSHELRTPLTSIRGFAQTLIAYKDKLSEEQKLKFLTNIEEQSDRLITLVENLLASSSSQHEKPIFICKSVNVNKAVAKTKTILQQKYPRKSIDVKINQNFPEIIADSDKFEQILLNLMENACKYSYENTDILVTGKSDGETEAEISIENDGITIPDKDKKKVFEKFSRLDNPMTRLTQGSGIGLYLASEMAKKMSGRIELESKDEHTTFTVIFPVATPEKLTQCRLKAAENA